MYGQYGIGAVVLTIVVMVLTRRPSDAYIDGVVAEEMKKLEAAALKKLGLDKEEVSVAEPIMTYGYLTKVNQISIADETLGKTKIVTGKDKLERSPVVGMHFFGFSENEIYYYGQEISLVSDTCRAITSVINYGDVVSVRSDTVIEPAVDFETGKEDPKKRVKSDFFSVNAGGDSIVCFVRNSDEADAHVNALRALVKQKKNA